jgi:hypothetical protein
MPSDVIWARPKQCRAHAEQVHRGDLALLRGVSTSSRLNGNVTENAGIERPTKSYRLARAARFRVRGVSENDGVSGWRSGAEFGVSVSPLICLRCWRLGGGGSGGAVDIVLAATCAALRRTTLVGV